MNTDIDSGNNSKNDIKTLEKCFVNRELSWLQFNLRVLKEAADKTVPILERLKFISIYYSNLSEFFMVRVGTIIHRIDLIPDYKDSITGLDGRTVLKKILKEVRNQQSEAEKIYKEIMDELNTLGVDIINFNHISKVDEAMTKKFFTDAVDQMTPHVIGPLHPVPFMGNNEEYVVSYLKSDAGNMLGYVSLFRIPKFKSFEVDGRQKIVIMSELICHFAQKLFKNYHVVESHVIKMTRNADVFIDDDMHARNFNFLTSMEKMLNKRKRLMPVRLEVQGKLSEKFKSLLCEKLNVPDTQVFQSILPMNYSFSSGIKCLPGMKYNEQKPVRTIKLHKGEYFNYLEKQDILLSFPYQSITPFIEMIYEAADDPDVASIKITLYRLAASSKLAAALCYASDQGKDVLCLLELRARFDEQNNIDYSEVLSSAGCKIIYGLPDQKVHSKLCVITRNKNGVNSYITQIGTGNYNEITSELYCDLSLITSDTQTGLDAVSIFADLEKGLVPAETPKLWVAPNGFVPNMMKLMERERQKGKDGFISLKFNSLNDEEIMEEIIKCCQAGNTVELFVRGICCLKPDIPGFTDGLVVRSVVGRYLEHSRIYVFGKDESSRKIFIGSGDLLNRNTRRRVEVFTEVTSKEIVKQVLEVMEAFRNDKEKGWLMQSNGTYTKEENHTASSSQDRLYKFFEQQIVASSKNNVSNENKEKKPGFFTRLFSKMLST